MSFIALHHILEAGTKKETERYTLVHNILCFYKSILLGIWKAKEEVYKGYWGPYAFAISLVKQFFLCVVSVPICLKLWIMWMESVAHKEYHRENTL